MTDQQMQELEQVITALQDALSQAEEREAHLRAELSQVKEDNLRLAEANLKLQAQMPAPLVKPNPQKPVVRGRSRPIGSNAELSKVNSQNIGWFD